MKAVRLHSIGHLYCDEVSVPVPHGEELLIKVGACGICGSDIPRTYVHGTSSGIYPLTIGHEFSGEVVQVGEKANTNLIGKRGAIFPLIPCRECNPCVAGNYAMCEHYDYLGSRRDGGFAEYCLIPSEWHFIQSQEATMEELAMTEPACVAQHAVRRAQVSAGQYIVIFGAGPIGIMAARWVRIFGAEPLLVDISDEKVAFAKSIGFESLNSKSRNVAEEIRRRNNGSLADAAIEGTGAGAVLSACVECVRPCGTVALLGNPANEAVISTKVHSEMLRKEININGVWNSSRAPYPVNEWVYTVRMMDEKVFKCADLITDRFSLEELPDVMQGIKDGMRHIMKAVYSL